MTTRFVVYGICPRQDWMTSLARSVSMRDFILALGKYPGPGYSVDRIDNDGHYEAGNIRWADRVTQQNNRRKVA